MKSFANFSTEIIPTGRGKMTLSGRVEFTRQKYWSGLPFPSPGDLPNPGIKPRSPTLQVDSLPAELQGKPNTGVGSLSLLQRIFPTQESNPGLPHCRWILSQLSHKGSPRILEWVAYPFSSRSSHPEIKLGSPAVHADSLSTELSGKPSDIQSSTLSAP